MSELKLFLLGSPRIELHGRPVEVDTRKAIALLAYLAATGGSHHRDTLATLLWPESDQIRARGAFRRTLSALKNAIGAQWLQVTREQVALKSGSGLWVDLHEFRKHLAEVENQPDPALGDGLQRLASLSAAVDLYRGDFLAGFTLRDSVNFDDWQFFLGDTIRRELGGALEGLVRGHTFQGAFPKAIEYAHRWLALDPLHEPIHRQMMQLYAWGGRRDAALRQYRQCVRVLEKELGVPPLEETVRLYEAIKENRLPPPPLTQLGGAGRQVAALRQQTPPSKRTLPFVGRAAESSLLRDTYNSLSTDGRFIVVEGEAGIGKTRLVEEFLSHTAGLGAATLTARCYEGETNLSYGPFIEGLRASLDRDKQGARLQNIPTPWLADTARLLPEILALHPDLPDPPALDEPGAQSRFFEAVAQVLLAFLEGPAPGVLFIDDLQWADTASLDLLNYLVRRLPGRPILIIAAWRPEEVGPSHRLRQLLREAQRSSAATQVQLDRLMPGDVQEIVQSLLEQGLDPRLGERLYHETEGLPFFLTEYISVILKEGEQILEQAGSLPGGAGDLLRTRLAATSETGWQVLTSAAAIGRSFGFEILKAASGRGEEETIAALEELLDQGLIREIKAAGQGQDISYDFSHEKLRHLVYDETSLARRRLLHRRVAEALINRARNRKAKDLPAGQIAFYFDRAGQAAEAAHYYQVAGDQARAVFANLDALHHFQTALALGNPHRVTLHEAIGDLQTLIGEFDAAITSYEAAAAFSDPSALSNLEHKLGKVYHRLGDWQAAEIHYRSALQAHGDIDGAGISPAVYADWSLTAHQRGLTDQARQLADQGLALAQAAGDRRALAQSRNILGILARGQDDLSGAREHLEKSLALAEQLDDPGLRIAALNNLALVFQQQGDLARAIDLLREAVPLCVSQGDRHREAALHNNLADLFHARGDSQASMEHLRKSVAIYAEIGEQAGTWQPEIWKLLEW